MHFDPCDVSRVWVRNHHESGWIQANWTHLRTAPVPFGETIRKQSQKILAERGQRAPTQAEIAEAAEELLTRAAAGPPEQLVDKKIRRKLVRAQHSTVTPLWPRPAPDLPADGPVVADRGDGTLSCGESRNTPSVASTRDRGHHRTVRLDLSSQAPQLRMST